AAACFQVFEQQENGDQHRVDRPGDGEETGDLAKECGADVAGVAPDGIQHPGRVDNETKEQQGQLGTAELPVQCQYAAEQHMADQHAVQPEHLPQRCCAGSVEPGV